MYVWCWVWEEKVIIPCHQELPFFLWDEVVTSHLILIIIYPLYLITFCCALHSFFLFLLPVIEKNEKRYIKLRNLRDDKDDEKLLLLSAWIVSGILDHYSWTATPTLGQIHLRIQTSHAIIKSHLSWILY